MRPATYDKIFDNFNKFAARLIVMFVVYVILFFITNFMSYMFLDKEIWVNLANIWFHISSFVGSIIITLIFISYATAYSRFQITRLRDIWMARATALRYYEVDVNGTNKANIWIDENLTGLYRIIKKGPSVIFVFNAKEDAMAFKLAWEGTLTPWISGDKNEI